MDIEFIGGGIFALTNPHQIDEALEDFGGNLKQNVVNSETSYLFTISDKAKHLDEKRK